MSVFDDAPFRGYGGLPIQKQTERPSLKDAVSFYNASVRPRRGLADKKRLEFGETRASEAYPIFATSHEELSKAFGLGVAMYFATLQILIVVCLVCGLLQLPALLFYAGVEYSTEYRGEDANGKKVPFLLRGSAACTMQERVCMDQDCEAQGQINTCRIGEMQMRFDLCMTGGLFVFLTIFSVWQQKRVNELDEGIQTSQDCKLCLDNWPLRDNHHRRHTSL